MARERIGMVKIREILRLKYELGMSNRQIAVSCGAGRRAVSEYLVRAAGAGVTWTDAQKLSDTDLEGLLFKQRGSAGKKSEPDWNYIYKELKRPHVTQELLWQEHKEENPDGCQYSWFNEQYGRWRKRLNISMRQEHRAGEKMFVDYCDGLYVTDRETGEKIPTELFVSVWGASNYTYAEASFSQGKESWLMAHVRAFEYSGCVPRTVVPDNLKAGVTKACRYEPEINRTYLDMAQHYGTMIIPARPGKPKDKAKVEVGVQVAQRWILACLRNRTFYSLREMNDAIGPLREKLNNRQMRKLNRSRKELFETLDKPAALALVGQRYEYADWHQARVNIDYHIEIGKHWYSVPYQLIHEQVDVRISGHTVEVFYKNKRITSHARTCRKGGYTTKPEHLPPAHRAHLEWTPERIVEWAGKTGACTKEVVTIIIASKKYPELAYRSCLGIFRLQRQYPKERIENAARRALKYRTCTYQNMKAILAHGLDQQTDVFSVPGTLISPMHENIRGQEYYRKTDGQPQ